jgi:hypothetical protein
MKAFVPALVTVALHVLNPAHVSPPQLEVAENVAALIYANAGVKVLWMNDERLPSTDVQPAESNATGDLWVVLLRGGTLVTVR